MLVAIILIAAFAAAAAGDFVESYFVRRVQEGDAPGAARMSATMYAVSLIGFLAIVELHGPARYAVLVVECVGVYLGTRLAVRRQVRRKNTTTTASRLRVVA